ncbi:hypothetical protein E2C01_085628 [Portunus trituberculatus]|uniref:Uncharacterized protein n=1 Tax=Portunus trituberculatus TaxID=210409 RepID=A0A5B7IYM1_PORTR|nr:hypothetical protein [Portunus trituberculatus]
MWTATPWACQSTLGIQTTRHSKQLWSVTLSTGPWEPPATLEDLQARTEENRMKINHNKTVIMHVFTYSAAVSPPQLFVWPRRLQVVCRLSFSGSRWTTSWPERSMSPSQSGQRPTGCTSCADSSPWRRQQMSLSGCTSPFSSPSPCMCPLTELRSLEGQRVMLPCEVPSPIPGDDIILVLFYRGALGTPIYVSVTWSSSLSSTQQQQLENVQKRACRIILGPAYNTN